MSFSKRQTYQRGINSEKWAALWLQLKGYKILERRYKTSVGEIDLIASKNNVIVFVEVKARPTADLALESITHSMKKRISNTAQYYIGHHNVTDSDFRFDVIAVTPFRQHDFLKSRFFIHHLDNAWETGA